MKRALRPYCWLRGHREIRIPLLLAGPPALTVYRIVCGRCGYFWGWTNTP